MRQEAHNEPRLKPVTMPKSYRQNSVLRERKNCYTSIDRACILFYTRPQHFDKFLNPPSFCSREETNE